MPVDKHGCQLSGGGTAGLASRVLETLAATLRVGVAGMYLATPNEQEFTPSADSDLLGP